MISRRNIRVKVMQTLYTLQSGSTGIGTESEDVYTRAARVLDEKLDRSADLFTVLILYITSVAQYAEKDAARRSSKYLPTAADLVVSTRIAANDALWKVLNNETFSARVKERHLERFIDEDWIKKIYNALQASPAYEEYIGETEKNLKKEKAIIQHIWNEEILKNEGLLEHFSDELPGWEDDREMVLMLMQNFLQKPQKVNFLEPLAGDKRAYARDLLRYTLDREEYSMELIRPKLVNWEADRVALIDVLLLRMGICELLYFPTIPTKVTINEYIELAKAYSTPQSSQFVNGVLDNVLRDLKKEGLVDKPEQYRKP